MCSNIGWPRDYHTKWNTLESQILYDINYMCNLKHKKNELIYKMETDSHRKQTYDYRSGEGMGEG